MIMNSLTTRSDQKCCKMWREFEEHGQQNRCSVWTAYRHWAITIPDSLQLSSLETQPCLHPFAFFLSPLSKCRFYGHRCGMLQVLDFSPIWLLPLLLLLLPPVGLPPPTTTTADSAAASTPPPSPLPLLLSLLLLLPNVGRNALPQNLLKQILCNSQMGYSKRQQINISLVKEGIKYTPFFVKQDIINVLSQTGHWTELSNSSNRTKNE